MTDEHVRITDYGFRWEGGNGADIEVSRMASFPRKDGVCRVLGLKTEHKRLEIYVSPKGRSVHVWLDGKEMTVDG